MTEIYIIRHAEAEGNVGRRIHGHYNSLITANGEKQVSALEKRFEPIQIDACYASDLKRTCMTAKAIYVPKNLPLHKDARLREVYMGVWEDLPFGYLYRFCAEQMSQLNDAPLQWRVEGAERFEAYTARFLAAMTQAAVENDGKTIAIFTHGCILRGVQLRLFFDPAHPGKQHCDNTAVSHLYYDNGKYSYDYLNDNSHLSEDISTLAKQNWWRSSGNTKDFNLYYQPLSDTAMFCTACEDAEKYLSRTTTQQQRLAYLQTLLEEGEVLTAFLDGTPIGLVATKKIGCTPDSAALELAWLSDGFRRKGYGAQLVGAAISYARKNGCTRLYVQVGKRNETAVRFYQRNSFCQCEKIAKQSDELILCRNLHMEI